MRKHKQKLERGNVSAKPPPRSPSMFAVSHFNYLMQMGIKNMLGMLTIMESRVVSFLCIELTM